MGDTAARIADSLGWALLHSIWQIAIVAIVVFAALQITPRRNPQLRFAFAYLGMVGALVAFAVTFLVYLTRAEGGGGQADWLVATLGDMTGFVSLGWAAGFTCLLVRYLRALEATHRLRREGVSAVPDYWQQRFRLWAERLGADRNSAIFQSALISTPLTIGTLKPVVLVPVGFFLRMPADQAEAILVHELAHICRQDYLLGLVQTMIANIFFFHPAIYYLSRQVDAEREYACDARVVQETGDASALATALGRIAMCHGAGDLGFAVAAEGKATPVMDRIRRLADRPARRGQDAGVPIAAMATVFAASLTVAIGADAATTGSAAPEQATVPETAEPAAAPARLDEAAEAPADACCDDAEAPASHAAGHGHEATAEDAPSSEAPARHAAKTASRATEPATVRIAWTTSSSPERSAVRLATVTLPDPAGLASFVRYAAFDSRSSSDSRSTSNSRSASDSRSASAGEDAKCEESAERALAVAERARERAERQRERLEARIERDRERYAMIAEREAERIEMQQERIAEAAEARAERQRERAEAQAEALRVFEEEADRAATLTISYAIDPVPAIPAIPAIPAVPARPAIAVTFRASTAG